MYTLKQIPEDFIVKEIPDREFGEEGIYMICILKKKNYNTEDALQQLAKALNTTRKNIGFAGTKDRNAITQQHISLFKGSIQRIQELKLKDIELIPAGRSKQPLSLGDLKGNEFIITIRNLESNTKIKKLDKFPNFFDSQRFSGNNVEIGKLIVQKKFKDACILLEKDSKHSIPIKEALEKQPNNYVNAIQSLPEKLLLLFLHAFQSKIWNETLEQYLKTKTKHQKEKVPLVGFEEIEDKELKKIILEILEREGINQREFIIREIPSLTLEGSERKTHAEIHNLKIGKLEDDELNKGKKKILLSFWLDKGSYATMAIKYLLEDSKNNSLLRILN